MSPVLEGKPFISLAEPVPFEMAANGDFHLDAHCDVGSMKTVDYCCILSDDLRKQPLSHVMFDFLSDYFVCKGSKTVAFLGCVSHIFFSLFSSVAMVVTPS